MIGCIILETNDLPRARSFYDTVLAEMGVTRLKEFDARGLCAEGGDGFYGACFRDLDGTSWTSSVMAEPLSLPRYV